MFRLAINKYWFIGILILLAYFVYTNSKTNKLKERLYEVESKAFYNNVARYQVRIDSAQKHSERLIVLNDSINKFIEVIEAKRKQDFYIYQKKLNEVSKVNTYIKRQHYADSLERTMR